MKRGHRLVSAAFALLSVASASAAACSSASQDSCTPPPESCDLGEASMHVYDPAHDCLGEVASLVGTCATSVNRCTPSAGIGVVCAVSARGVAYTTVATDNVVFTGTGWEFDQPLDSTPDPDNVAQSEEVSTQAAALCARAECAPACPGVTLDDGQHLNCSGAGAP